MTSLTEGLQGIRNRHFEFIEATFHIRHARLLEERQRLLREGSVFREPWVEATPTYERRQSIADLGLPGVVASLLEKFAASKLGVFDPPYVHQAQALESFFVDRKDLVGLRPPPERPKFSFIIVGELALEGARHRSSNVRGVRAWSCTQ